MDRQDPEIDALLIGALYGELTPADEARLAAHLESHPTDRGALDDLRNARQAVRASRIFELQLDPPQAVSALLLQEAHRRAPKRVVAKEEESEGWFYRFTRAFLAHPAMAAAAMLVLVVGVAGTVYMKKGDSQFVDKEAAAPAASEASTLAAPTGGTLAEAPAEAPAAMPTDPVALEGAAGSGYTVDLDDDKLAEDRGLAKLETASDRKQRAVLAAEPQRQAVSRERDEAKSKKSAAIVVDTPRPQPKELPERRAKGASSSDRYDDEARDGFAGGVGSTTIASGGGGEATASRGMAQPPPGAGPARAPAQVAPPPPPPPAAATPAPAPNNVAQSKAPAKPTTTAKSSPKPSGTKEAEKSEAPKAEAAPAKDDSLIAWAKSEHSRSVALANKGDCVGAAKAAVLVLNRVPDYYSQFMATDRLLKKCQAYVAAERDSEANRNKARPKRATSADEATSN